MATSPEIVPEIETTDQPNGECDLLESRTTASFRGATILAQTMQKEAAAVLLSDRRYLYVKKRRSKSDENSDRSNAISQREATWM